MCPVHLLSILDGGGVPGRLAQLAPVHREDVKLAEVEVATPELARPQRLRSVGKTVHQEFDGVTPGNELGGREMRTLLLVNGSNLHSRQNKAIASYSEDY